MPLRALFPVNWNLISILSPTFNWFTPFLLSNLFAFLIHPVKEVKESECLGYIYGNTFSRTPVRDFLNFYPIEIRLHADRRSFRDVIVMLK